MNPPTGSGSGFGCSIPGWTRTVGPPTWWTLTEPASIRKASMAFPCTLGYRTSTDQLEYCCCRDFRESPCHSHQWAKPGWETQPSRAEPLPPARSRPVRDHATSATSKKRRAASAGMGTALCSRAGTLQRPAVAVGGPALAWTGARGAHAGSAVHVLVRPMPVSREDRAASALPRRCMERNVGEANGTRVSFPSPPGRARGAVLPLSRPSVFRLP